MKFKKGNRVITKYGNGFVIDIDKPLSNNPRPIVEIDETNKMSQGFRI